MGPPSSWPLLLGWAAGADLATMAPVYCPPHAARTRGRELCPTDAVCAASVTRFAAAARRAPPRVAVLLRGVAFRNWGSRDTEGSCCRGTEASQRSVVESWNEHLFAPLEARGYEVNIYVATYRCSNGKDWVERDLLSQLAPRLRGVYLCRKQTFKAPPLDICSIQSVGPRCRLCEDWHPTRWSMSTQAPT